LFVKYGFNVVLTLFAGCALSYCLRLQADLVESFALHAQYPSLTFVCTTGGPGGRGGGGNVGGKSGAVNSAGSSSTLPHPLEQVTKKKRVTEAVSSSQNSKKEEFSSSSSVFQRKIVLIRDPSLFGEVEYGRHNTNSNSKNRESNKEGFGASHPAGLLSFLLTCPHPVIMIVGNVSAREDFQYTVDRSVPLSVRSR
jgi:hypothetical protein